MNLFIQLIIIVLIWLFRPDWVLPFLAFSIIFRLFGYFKRTGDVDRLSEWLKKRFKWPKKRFLGSILGFILLAGLFPLGIVPATADSVEDYLLVGDQGTWPPKLTLADPNDGSIVREFSLGFQGGYLGEYILSTIRNGVFYGVGDSPQKLFALDLADGSIIWSRLVSAYPHPHKYAGVNIAVDPAGNWIYAGVSWGGTSPFYGIVRFSTADGSADVVKFDTTAWRMNIYWLEFLGNDLFAGGWTLAAGNVSRFGLFNPSTLVPYWLKQTAGYGTAGMSYASAKWNGNTIMGDNSVHRFRVYDPAGVEVAVWDQSYGRIMNFYADGNHLYVANFGNRVSKYLMDLSGLTLVWTNNQQPASWPNTEGEGRIWPVNLEQQFIFLTCPAPAHRAVLRFNKETGTRDPLFFAPYMLPKDYLPPPDESIDLFPASGSTLDNLDTFDLSWNNRNGFYDRVHLLIKTDLPDRQLFYTRDWPAGSGGRVIQPIHYLDFWGWPDSSFIETGETGLTYDVWFGFSRFGESIDYWVDNWTWTIVPNEEFPERRRGLDDWESYMPPPHDFRSFLDYYDEHGRFEEPVGIFGTIGKGIGDVLGRIAGMLNTFYGERFSRDQAQETGAKIGSSFGQVKQLLDDFSAIFAPFPIAYLVVIWLLIQVGVAIFRIIKWLISLIPTIG